MKVRFGMMMTDAVGKAGGQCIQRRGNTRVLRNITIPTQRIASTQNPQRFINNFLFSQWSRLNPTEQNEWFTVSEVLRGKDTFGDEKSFTPRECFSKCNGTLYPATKVLIDASVFNFSVPVLEVDEISIDLSDNDFILNIASEVDVFRTQIKAKRLANYSQSPKVYKLKTFDYAIDNTDSHAIFAKFEAMFPQLNAGDYWSIAVRGISASGLVSPWVQKLVRVDN